MERLEDRVFKPCPNSFETQNFFEVFLEIKNSIQIQSNKNVFSVLTGHFIFEGSASWPHIMFVWTDPFYL